MSQTQLHVDIVTPNGILFSDSTTSCIAKGVDGKFQVLSNHAALISNIALGEIRIDSHNTTRKLATSGGFLEVKDNNISIIVETAEWSDEIDIKRAQKAKERAENRLKQKEDIDITRAKLALARSLNRLNIASGI